MCLHDDLASALETLELLGPSGQFDFLVTASMETQGYFKPPRPGDNWDNQMVEIKAHGLLAEGADISEAIRNWKCMAKQQVRIETQLHSAEYILVQPLSHTGPITLRAACHTILDNSPVAQLLIDARTALTDLDAINRRSMEGI